MAKPPRPACSLSELSLCPDFFPISCSTPQPAMMHLALPPLRLSSSSSSDRHPPSLLPFNPTARSSDPGWAASSKAPFSDSDFIGERLQRKPLVNFNRLCNRSFTYKAGVRNQSLSNEPQEPCLLEVKERRDGYDISKLGATPCYDQFMNGFDSSQYPRKASLMPSLPGVSEGLEHVSLQTGRRKGLWGTGAALAEGINYHPSSAFKSRYHGGHSNQLRLQVLQQSFSWGQAPEQSVEMAVQTSAVPPAIKYSDLTKQLGLAPSFAKVHKLAKASGCMSLGVYRNELITNIEGDSTDFFQPGNTEWYSQEDGWQGAARALGDAHTPMMMMAIKALPEVIDVDNSLEFMSAVKSTTTKRHQSAKVQTKSTVRPRKNGKALSQRRDLFRSPFQLYGVVLCYPFMNAKTAAASLQAMSRESLEELVVIFNQIAVGLVGSGFALVVFVALRMLTINATFDSSKVTVLIRGIGLIWLSSAVKRLRGLVKCMTTACTKFEKKELMAKLRNELQALTFKAFTLIILLVVRFA